MTYTVVHFVRHGEVYNPNHVLYERLPDFHLSDRGRAMAQITAGVIAKNPVMNCADAVFVSPLDRTYETALPILEQLNALRESQGKEALKAIPDKRIIETRNELRGKRIGKGRAAYWRWNMLKMIWNPWKPSWGETYDNLASRMSDFLYDKVDEYAGKTIIAVSHESPIWTLRRYVEVGKAHHLPWQRHTSLASITSLTIDVDTHELISVAYDDTAFRTVDSQ